MAVSEDRVPSQPIEIQRTSLPSHSPRADLFGAGRPQGEAPAFSSSAPHQGKGGGIMKRIFGKLHHDRHVSVQDADARPSEEGRQPEAQTPAVPQRSGVATISTPEPATEHRLHRHSLTRSSSQPDPHLGPFEYTPIGRTVLEGNTELRAMTGLQVLDALEEGASMRVRREGTTFSSTGMGRSALVRCVVEGAHAKLVLEGQGLASLLRHASLVGGQSLEAAPKATVQRVEVLDGPWFRRKSIEVSTAAGSLSLVPGDKQTYALWVLGFNTALTAVELHKGDGIHPMRPARKLPCSHDLRVMDVGASH